MNYKGNGVILSSSFTVWQEKEYGRNRRFVLNLSQQSKHWGKGSMRMETLSEFSINSQRGDHFLSIDIVKRYLHLRFHPSMRDWFIFRYQGSYFQCVALRFGWGCSPLWFTPLMAPFVRELMSYGYRVLPYHDEFLIAPAPDGVFSSKDHFHDAKVHIEGLMRQLGIKRQETNVELQGS